MAGDENNKPSLKVRIAARFLRLVLHTLAWTWTLRWVEGEERYRENLQSKEPVILCTWHNRMFFYGWFLEKFCVQQGWPFGVMSSRSRDGDFGAEMARLGGGAVARGSSGQGGSASLKQFIRFIREESVSVILLNDASRGPIYKAKKGAVVLSKVTGAPMIPTMWTASREWVFKNAWDRFKIPKPFATIYLSWGEPVVVPRKQSAHDDEVCREQLEDKLNRLKHRCGAEADSPPTE